MANPNDLTSDVYDLVSAPVKGSEITNEEIALISSLIPPNSKILDIGVGTGRHFIPLSELGFNITGIDSSKGMLDVLKLKIKNYKLKNTLIYGNILDYSLPSTHYSLIILMWNSFNEIALSDKSAQLLFQIFGKLLDVGGKVLINSDNPEETDLKDLDFELNYTKNNKDYKIHWKTKEYNKDLDISTSLEEVTFPSGKIITTEIKQRWYTFSDYKAMGERDNFKVEKFDLKRNNELYIIFTKLS